MKSELQVPIIGDIAEIVGVQPDTLEKVISSKEQLYRRFSIRSGGSKRRWIDAPKHPLKRIQRALLDDLLYRYEPSKVAHGFFPGRSILTNAAVHVRQAWVMSFDVTDFFPSTSEESVHDVLCSVDPSRSRDFWGVVSGLCTLRGILPQGAPTSPHLANLVCLKLDEVILRIAANYGLNYTRYADDLTFSGQTRPEALVGEVRQTLAAFGYRLSEKKTKVMGRHQRQLVTGLVVNEKVALPRELKRQLRAIVHDAQLNGIENACHRSGLVDTEEQLRGYLALVRAFIKELH